MAFAATLHVGLALASGIALLVVAYEAGRRLAKADQPASNGAALAALMLLVATSAVGAAMLARGERPREWLHFLYAGLTLAGVPYAATLGARWPRRRAAWALLVAALVSAVLVLRLYATG